MGVKPHIEIGTIFGTAKYCGDVPSDVRRTSKFICHCGKSFISRTQKVISGETKGCGCQKGQWMKNAIKNGYKPRLTHGMRDAKEYSTWSGMLTRCTNSKEKSYSRYGARGIKICERWKSFENFYADMGPRPSDEHSLDRIDNNADYSPENCRWATKKEQCRNRRSNHIIEYGGKSMLLCEWAEKTGIGRLIIYKRLKRGWPIEKALGFVSAQQTVYG